MDFLITLCMFVLIVVLGCVGVRSVVSLMKENEAEKKEEAEEFDAYLKSLGFQTDKKIVSEYGELYIDNTNKQWLLNLKKEDQIKIFDYSELLHFEIFEDGDSVASGRAGSALVGGLLFGVAGAVVGSSGSKKITNNCSGLELRVTTTNFEHMEIVFPFIIFNTPKNSYKYTQRIQEARSMATALSYIQNEKG